jgi:hypothetical protein
LASLSWLFSGYNNLKSKIMRFIFEQSLTNEARALINKGRGAYTLGAGTLHVDQYGGRTYIVHEVNGLGNWHLLVQGQGETIEAIQADT